MPVGLCWYILGCIGLIGRGCDVLFIYYLFIYDTCFVVVVMGVCYWMVIL